VKSYHPTRPGSTSESSTSTRTPILQPKGRNEGTVHGGVPVMQAMLGRLGFAKAVNGAIMLFKVRRGYAESDHVLSIAFNPLCGGQTLDDIEQRRRDPSYLKSLGLRAIPDPTTAGDFCRRFDEESIFKLQDAVITSGSSSLAISLTALESTPTASSFRQDPRPQKVWTFPGTNGNGAIIHSLFHWPIHKSRFFS
jgi:hypothetical protein